MPWRWVALALVLAAVAVAALALRTWTRADAWYQVSRQVPPRPSDLAGVLDVRFLTRDGVTLGGWWLPPVNGAAIVLAHGLGQGRSGLLPEARILASSGYGVLLYDARGHGDSEGSVTLGDLEQIDIEAALAFVRRQPGVQRVGALGFSMGAVALAHVAAADPGLEAVVLLSPFASLQARLETDFGSLGVLSRAVALAVARSRGVVLDRVRPADVVHLVAPRTLLVIGGSEEWGRHLVEEVGARAPPGSEHWTIEGAGHGGFAETARPQYSARLLRYFDERLGAAAAAR